MRAIEFRAWYKSDQKMIHWNSESSFSFPSGDDMILMQYTGLKDAKGNKVYESDILEFDNGDRFFIDCEDWLELFVHWIGEPECEDQARDFYRIERAIVIGNIYENKELLNEQKTANIGTDRDG